MGLVLDELLARAVHSRASDVHLKVGRPPSIHIDGILHRPDAFPAATPDEIRAAAFGLMSSRQKQRFEATSELDLSHSTAFKLRREGVRSTAEATRDEMEQAMADVERFGAKK